MAVQLDIDTPDSNEVVGQRITVTGSYGNDPGNPFTFTCMISNSTYAKTLSVQPDYDHKTWSCVFDAVPVGTDYTITANDPSSTTGSGSGSGDRGGNPVVGIDVRANPPIRITGIQGPPNMMLVSPGQSGDDSCGVFVQGESQAGFTLGDGYIPYVYLRAVGQQYSGRGHLTKYYQVASEDPTVPPVYTWEYAMRCPGWALTPAVSVVVELWKVQLSAHADASTEMGMPMPVVTVSSSYPPPVPPVSPGSLGVNAYPGIQLGHQ